MRPRVYINVLTYKDIVLIDYRRSTIHVDSSVFKPGIYESIKGETLKDLIDFVPSRVISPNPDAIEPTDKAPTV